MFAFGAKAGGALHSRVLPERHPSHGRRQRLARAHGGGPAVAAEDGGEGGRLHRGHNYVALPAGRPSTSILALEEAKLQRMPPPKELSRRICLIVGAQRHRPGGGLEAAALGAHLIVADVNERRRRGGARGGKSGGPEHGCAVRRRHHEPQQRPRMIQTSYAGSAASTSSSTLRRPSVAGSRGRIKESSGVDARRERDANYLLADEPPSCSSPGTPAAIVLTSSANAVVPEGSEAYDVSKSASATSSANRRPPGAERARQRIAPATVVSGSTMFPRDR